MYIYNYIISFNLLKTDFLPPSPHSLCISYIRYILYVWYNYLYYICCLFYLPPPHSSSTADEYDTCGRKINSDYEASEEVTGSDGFIFVLYLLSSFSVRCSCLLLLGFFFVWSFIRFVISSLTAILFIKISFVLLTSSPTSSSHPPVQHHLLGYPVFRPPFGPALYAACHHRPPNSGLDRRWVEWRSGFVLRLGLPYAPWISW